MKTIVVIYLLVPIIAFGQSKSIDNFIAKWKGNQDVSVVNISGSLFNLLSEVTSIDKEDEEMEAMKRIFRNIQSMKIVSVPYRIAEFSSTRINELKNDLENDQYEELMTLRDNEKNFLFMAQGDNSTLSNMVVLIDDDDQFTVLSVLGSLDMKDLALLARNHKEFR